MRGDSRARVRSAWASLAQVEDLEPLQVLAQPAPFLCRPGWIGLLRIEDSVTVVSPNRELVEQLEHALAGLSPADALSPNRVVPRLPNIVETLGPASLSYLGDHGVTEPPVGAVELADVASIGGLVAAVSPEELDESSIARVTSRVSVVRDEHGEAIAACGYRHWPAAIAHLCVLTRADRRNMGCAKAVAADAASRALAEGLLPQWRARTAASQAVARAIGFEEVGAQLSLRQDSARQA